MGKSRVEGWAVSRSEAEARAGATPLHLAAELCQYRHVCPSVEKKRGEVARLLVDAGADEAATNDAGQIEDFI